MSFPKELSLNKLKAIAEGWVEKYAGYISEISFFCSAETTLFNLNEHAYCIDFVLCDPPRIEPENFFHSNKHIEREGGILKVSLLEAMPEPTVEEMIQERQNSGFDKYGINTSREELRFLDQWLVYVRWETDQQNSYIPDSKQVLYSRPKNQSYQKLQKLSRDEYEHLKRLPYFTIEECISLMTGIPCKSTEILIKNGKLDIQAAPGIVKKFKDCINVLTRSIEVGGLHLKDNFEPQTINADQFIKWAYDKGYEPCVGLYKQSGKYDALQKEENPDQNSQDVKSPQTLLDNAILSISSEVEQLYNGMSKKLRNQGLKILQSSGDDKYEACLEYFKEKSSSFLKLEKKDIEDIKRNNNINTQYWETDNTARDIKGALIEQYISEKHPKLYHDKNLKTNFQALYYRYRELVKKTL